MKDFDVATLFAIASEALGPWIWVGIVAGIAVLTCYVAAVLRGNHFAGTPVKLSVIVGILVVLGFAAFAPILTDASYGDLSLPVDWSILIIAALTAGIAVFLGLLPVITLLAGRRSA